MNELSNAKKIGFISSSGGHLEELLCLREIADENISFYVTEKSGQIEDSKIPNAYSLDQINRHEKGFVKHFFQLFVEAFRIMKKENPEAIITTGALISFPFCVIAKVLGKKVIYIESFARVQKKSLTGKLVYPFADLFLVQWETMLDCYPKAKYVGGIF